MYMHARMHTSNTVVKLGHKNFIPVCLQHEFSFGQQLCIHLQKGKQVLHRAKMLANCAYAHTCFGSGFFFLSFICPSVKLSIFDTMSIMEMLTWDTVLIMDISVNLRQLPLNSARQYIFINERTICVCQTSI